MKKITFISFITMGLIFSSYAQDTDDSWTLQECIEYAMSNNLDIKRSELNVHRNQVNLTQAKAQRYPSIQSGGGYGYRWGRSIDPTSNLFVSQRITSSGISANSSMPIFSGFQINNSIKQNEVDVRASKFDLEDMQNMVSLDIIASYMDVIFNKALVDNAEMQLETIESQVAQTKKLVDAGAVPVSDLLEVQSQQASDEVELINAQNNLDLAILTLKQILQIPASQEFELDIPELDVDEYDFSQYSITKVYDAALMSQPMIKSANLKQESAELGVKVSKGAYYPQIGIRGEMFTNYSDVALGPPIPGAEPTEVPTEIGYLANDPAQKVYRNITFEPRDQNYSILEQFGDNLSKSLSLSLTVPIFNNLNTRSNVQRAIIANDEAKINVEETKNQLRQTIERAYNDAQAASKSYKASEIQVEALEETFRSIEKRYNLGAVDFVDYQLANNNLFRARTQSLRSKYEYLFRVKVLDFYMGNPLTF